LKTILKHIAQLSSGIYTKPDFEGDVYYVQARHFNKDGEFDFSVKPDLKLEGKIEKHLLKPGDILLAVKGTNNFAVQYKGLIEKAVASSTFIVIRLRDQNQVLPEFLCWYLNHPQTQLFFKDRSRGSAIPSITIGTIDELTVFVPTVQKQKIILELHNLRKKEKEIKRQIETLRENHIQQQLLDSIKR
jgi:restriction endonuclease S subunit